MSTTTSGTTERCPRCSAHVRAGSDWCTLCYIDLRPEPVRAPTAAAAEPAAEPAAAVDPSLTAVPADASAAADDPAPAQPAPRRGTHARPAPASSADETEALAAQLLAQLAVSESGPGLGKLASLTDSSGKKVGVMIGGSMAVIVVLFVLMAILGSLL